MVKRILFWGEFPPNTQTGISICNEMILEILKKNSIDTLLVEEYSWNKKGARKIVHLIDVYVQIIRKAWKDHLVRFYFNLPLSKAGMAKILIILPIIKLIRHSCTFMGHLHRGDFTAFIQRNNINKILTGITFSFLDELIVLSPQYQKEVNLYTRRIKTHVLYNTSSIEQFGGKAPNPYRYRYICISNFIPSKRILELVECFNKPDLAELKLDIYGQPYDPEYIKKISRIATKNISIHGPLERSEIANCMKNSDCLVIPSWNEGQPLIIMEAMSLGIPVIACDVGDIPNMLGITYPFLVKPGDKRSLLQTITAFHNYKEKSRISEMLLKKYQYDFANEKFYKNVISIFKLNNYT